MNPNIDITPHPCAPQASGHGSGEFTLPTPVLTNAQTRALELMVALGNLFYRGRGSHACAIKPRLFPLLVGPTGAGKSWLVGQAAEKLEAKLLHFTFGTWVPLGARHDRPTQITIIDALLRHRRVALYLDEIDKIGTTSSSDWGRGIINDLFAVLDQRLEALLFFTGEGSSRAIRDDDVGRELIEKYRSYGLLQARHVETSGAFAQFVKERARTGLWIVGSGTWQRLFEENGDARRIGFGAGSDVVGAAASIEADIIARIRKEALIPRELLARFATELVVLTYPSRAEIEVLLESFGINQLAASAGMPLKGVDLDMRIAGMRVLESLVTRLLLFEASRVIDPQEKDLILEE